MYGKPSIEFIPGKVRVYLKITMDAVVMNLGQYMSPEETIIANFERQSPGKYKILDPYAKSTKVLWRGEERSFVYLSTTFMDGDVNIIYQLQ
jgi:hypothetical protein